MFLMVFFFSFKQDFVSSNPTLVYIIRARNRIFSYQPALILAKIALQVCGICQICILCGVHYLHIHGHGQHWALEEFGFSFLLLLCLLLVGQRQNMCLGRLGLEQKNPLCPVLRKSEIMLCV